MKKMSPRGQRWLKSFHVFFNCLWVGAAFSLALGQFFLNPSDGMELYGATLTMKFIDDFVIIPGALGSLLTGLIYSLFTGWGWFKHNWVAVKWVINVGGVIFGTFWLGPWLNSLPPLAQEKGLAALGDPVFTANRTNLLVFGTLQALTVIFAAFISVLKPWKGRKG